MGEFLDWLGDRPLEDGQFMAVLCRDFEMELTEVERRMTTAELHDWRLLYDVEWEAEGQQQENASRRKGG